MIRNFNGQDIAEIIDIWNKSMPYDKIDNRMFVKNILLDLNFKPDGIFVYEEDNKIKGFVYSVKRYIPVDIGGDSDDDKGWICALGFEPDCLHVAPALIKRAEEYICSGEKKTVYACSYTPNYFYQGINKCYPEYMKLFESLGYEEIECSVSMKVDLTKYESPDYCKSLKEKLENEGFEFLTLTPEYITSWLTFQKPSWTHRFRRLLNESMDFGKINIAVYKGEVIGCNIFGDPNSTEERFGPFGVRDDFQGKGIGKILLDECLKNMKNRELAHAWMQWATAADYVVNMYKKFGFEIMNEYVIYKKQIEKENN